MRMSASSTRLIRASLIIAILIGLSAVNLVSQTNSAQSIILLSTEPDVGYSGDEITVSGETFTPGQTVEFVWLTWDGSYVTNAGSENVEYLGRNFQEKRLTLGTATVDGEGKVSATFTVPEDYGEVHEIHAVVDGQDVGQGGFRIRRTATISPAEGPVGTMITITIKGISVRAYENTMGVIWDNQYTGFMTAVTTNGTAVARIRAAGPVGTHILQLKGAAATVPYLNVQQSPVAHIAFDWSWPFTVTEGSPIPENTVEWPDADAVVQNNEAAPVTTTSNVQFADGISMSLEPNVGPINIGTTLSASGLPADADVSLFWVSARGNRVSPSGWSLAEIPLIETTTAADGSLEAEFEVPDDLGGWHAVKVVSGDSVVGEVPFYVERSLVSVTPQRVRVGETFTVNIKGVGWTELDNGFAVTYDNASIGYACGFNSNGDVTMNLVATGEPGIHLIDLYPMIYKGKTSEPPWNYELPFLTFAQDFPALGLGYRLPAFRLAIEVIE